MKTKSKKYARSFLHGCASADGDTGRVLSLMAEDVVFLVPGRPPMRDEPHLRQLPAALLEKCNLMASRRFKRFGLLVTLPTVGAISLYQLLHYQVVRHQDVQVTFCLFFARSQTGAGCYSGMRICSQQYEFSHLQVDGSAA